MRRNGSRRTDCKLCHNQRGRDFRKTNLSRIRAAQRDYYARNAEAIKRRARKYHNGNKEAIHQKRKSYFKEYVKRPEVRPLVNVAKAQYRAQQMKATPVWADKDKIEKVYWNAAVRGWHVDHVVPLRSAKVCGLHVWENLQVLSGPENSRKGNREWPDMP